MEAYHIRRSQPADSPSLVALWERSVRVTHTFLTDADIACYQPLVAEILAGDSLELWVLIDDRTPSSVSSVCPRTRSKRYSSSPSIEDRDGVAASLGTRNNAWAARSPLTSTRRITQREASTRRSDLWLSVRCRSTK